MLLACGCRRYLQQPNMLLTTVAYNGIDNACWTKRMLLVFTSKGLTGDDIRPAFSVLAFRKLHNMSTSIIDKVFLEPPLSTWYGYLVWCTLCLVPCFVSTQHTGPSPRPWTKLWSQVHGDSVIRCWSLGPSRWWRWVADKTGSVLVIKRSGKRLFGEHREATWRTWTSKIDGFSESFSAYDQVPTSLYILSDVDFKLCGRRPASTLVVASIRIFQITAEELATPVLYNGTSSRGLVDLGTATTIISMIHPRNPR